MIFVMFIAGLLWLTSPWVAAKLRSRSQGDKLAVLRLFMIVSSLFALSNLIGDLKDSETNEFPMMVIGACFLGLLPFFVGIGSIWSARSAPGMGSPESPKASDYAFWVVTGAPYVWLAVAIIGYMMDWHWRRG